MELLSKTQQTTETYTSELWFEIQMFLRSKGRSSKATRRMYRQKLERFAEWLETETEVREICDLRPRHMRAFMDYLEEEGHSEGGIHFYYRHIRAWLNWMKREFDWQDWNPLKNVDPPRNISKPYRPSPVEDVQAILNTCDRRTLCGIRDDALIRFFVDTGVRASEALRLKVGDVDLQTGDVHLRAEATKSRKARVVFLGNKALQALRRYVFRRRDVQPEDALWLNHSGEPWTYWGLLAMFTRRGAEAGLQQHPTPHRLRKTYATESHRHGEDLETLRQKLGHSSLLVTQTYLGLNEEDLREAHEEHSPGDRLL